MIAIETSATRSANSWPCAQSPHAIDADLKATAAAAKAEAKAARAAAAAELADKPA
ncbi:hypothetical protein [Cryobacterium sp. Y57]|uniref:hypothetical protein n=1 Tax=Cryobacterium sp. Y57 TaxID=2048287 RepID=UPI001304A02A|nr:hypothetical protein [Cryobacterium sp. Y57]